MNDNRVRSLNQIESRNGSGVSLQVLKDLSDALSGALEAMDSFQSPDVRQGISFYDEVRRFETDLIRNALKITAGSQTRAAKLLHINATTLNTKIKAYNIDWRNGYGGMPAARQNEGELGDMNSQR